MVSLLYFFFGIIDGSTVLDLTFTIRGDGSGFCLSNHGKRNDLLEALISVCG